MKKVLLILLFLVPSLSLAQSPVTVTGLITDAGNNPATSGTVQFNLIPTASSIHYFVAGVGTITQQVICGIDGTGHVKSNLNLANSCTVWGNDLINPANTQYKVTFAPNGNISNVVSGECITGANYSLNNPVFCPTVQVSPQNAIIRSNPFQVNILPIATNVFNIGSPSLQYAAGYFSGGLFINGNAVPSSGSSGTFNPLFIKNPLAPAAYQQAEAFIRNNGELNWHIQNSVGTDFVNFEYMQPFIQIPNNFVGLHVFPTPIWSFLMTGGLPIEGRFDSFIMDDPVVGPTITHSGAGSTGSPNYYFVCLDANSGTSQFSPAGVDAGGWPSGSLSGTNFNTISYTCRGDYSNAAIFRTDKNTNINQSGGGVLSQLPGACFSTSTGQIPCTFNDTGQATATWSTIMGAFFPNPYRNTTNSLFTAGQQFDFAGLNLSGGMLSNGQLRANILPNTPAPTVTTVGATGATSYSYFTVCRDYGLGVSLASPVTTIAHGNATLNTTNYNLVTPNCSGSTQNPPTNYYAADILKTNTATSLALGVLPGLAVADQGQATAAYVAPTRNSTADMVTAGSFTSLAGGGFSNFNSANFAGSIFMLPQGTATSGANFGSNNTELVASYWNGAAAANDTWDTFITLGTGTNPTSVYNIFHAGSPGATSVSIPYNTAIASPSTLFVSNIQANTTDTLFLNSPNSDTFLQSSGKSIEYHGTGRNFFPFQTDGLDDIGAPSNLWHSVFLAHTGSSPAEAVGEYVSSTIATGASIALTTNTTANITSISLTAGDWDVSGAVDFTFGATTSYTNLVGSISTTSATLGAQDSKFDFETPAAVPTAGADSTFALPVVRLSLGSTTTVFLVAQGTFTVSTLKAYGTIQARRWH